MADEDDLVQLIDDSGEVAPGPPRPWAIAAIDDDPAVHDGTRFALYDYTMHGQAPERRVIVDYDINDYKAKTELTADKLFTSLTAALRSYQQIQRMVATRRGLEIIIDAAAKLFDFRSMQQLAEGVLTQIASLL